MEQVRRVLLDSGTSPEELLEAVQGTPVIILEIDRDGEILLLNRPVPGIDSSGVIGSSAYDYLAGEHVDTMRTAIGRVFEAGEAVRYELEGPGEDGPVWYSSHAFPRLRGGEITSAVIITMIVPQQDVTRREQELRELKRRRQFDRLVIELSRLLIDLGPGELDRGVGDTLEALGIFLGVDRIFVFRMSPDGDHMHMTHEWKPTTGRAHIERYQEVPVTTFPWWLSQMRSGRILLIPDVEAWDADAPAEREAFERLGIESLASVPMMSDGELTGYLGLDTYGEKKTWGDEEIALLKLAGELLGNLFERERAWSDVLQAQKLESLGILAGGIAHDFNNLLTGIGGNLSLARRVGQGNPKLEAMLTDAQAAISRASDLTRQLLTFARGGAPVKEAASIVELVRDSTRFVLRGSNVRATFAFDSDVWPVEVDQSQISQVVQNLVINAMQAMPDGGSVDIAVSNVELTGEHELADGRYVKVTVADRGPGIDPLVLDRIFDPYFTTKTAGTGLGLATAYSVLGRHDGRLVVQSTSKAGATLAFYLPAATVEVTAPEPRPGPPPTGRGRILVMEDEFLLRRLAYKALSELGYEAVVVADGHEAIEAYQQARQQGQPFAAVLMDLTIPGAMGGKEALVELAAIDPEVCAIACSGYSNDPIMSDHARFGFRGVLAKPYDLDAMARALDTVIGAS